MMRNRFTQELAVCGYNAVAALQEYAPRKVNRLFLREERMAEFKYLCRNLAERKRAYKICGDEELEKICKTPSHQGLVAMIYAPEIEPVTRDTLADWETEAPSLILFLDHIGNEHNLGAVVRTAAYFGVKHIIICRDDEAGIPVLTTAAYRVAEGGMEHVKLWTLSDAASFLREVNAKHRAAFLTIATTLRTRTRLADLAAECAAGENAAPATKILLVGNEETGLSPELVKLCQKQARIPGAGLVDSLNVSAAAAIFMETFTRRERDAVPPQEKAP